MKWISKGVTISESSSHKGMFIFDDGTKFWNVHSTEELMLHYHPADRILSNEKPKQPIMLSSHDVAIYGSKL